MNVIVVYLLIPTSNHNFCLVVYYLYWLYIFWFLHQTTTSYNRGFVLSSCISFDSYIKPQRHGCSSRSVVVVYLLIPTSNHNSGLNFEVEDEVVYLLIPTSNHNFCWANKLFIALYIFWFLHQTTTVQAIANALNKLYIFWFLHQTTTVRRHFRAICCCISFDSYIKPQL